MERLALWTLLSVAYGGVLALLYQNLGQAGIGVWLVLVVVVQLLIRRRLSSG